MLKTNGSPQTSRGWQQVCLSTKQGYQTCARAGKKVYDKLISVGIEDNKALATAARNSYNAIVNTIDYEIKNLAIMEQKALKAFDIRNKAKDFARELSGPENAAAAEAKSAAKHGEKMGPIFDELYQKNYNKAVESGLQGEEAKNRAYEAIIESSKRTDTETNKKYGAK